jgi:hypothetical protein
MTQKYAGATYLDSLAIFNEQKRTQKNYDSETFFRLDTGSFGGINRTIIQ